MGNYKIQRISDTNYNSIKTLYLRCFNINESLENIQNKYETKSFGLKNTGFLAFDEKENPAAYYGVFPIRINYMGKDYLAAQSGDTMTDPDHRGKGLFIQLATETYNFAKENGVEFVFGFPNQNSFPGFKNKLNWEFYGNMQEFKIKTKNLPICEIVSKLKFAKVIYERYFCWRLKSYILQVTEENIKPFYLNSSESCIKKDIDFFNYKCKKGNYVLKINGFSFLLKPAGHLMIGDIAKFPIENFEDMLNSLKIICRKISCKRIVFLISKNHWLYKALNEGFDKKESLPIGFLRFNNEYQFEYLSFILGDWDTF